MLPKKERLTRIEFERLLSDNRLTTVYNQVGTLKYVPANQLKISVVTSGKNQKSAVLRNKLRRRIYSLVKTNKKPIAGVFYASKQSYTMDFEYLKKSFNELLKKAS